MKKFSELEGEKGISAGDRISFHYYNPLNRSMLLLKTKWVLHQCVQGLCGL
jgi:hypothetical protein